MASDADLLELFARLHALLAGSDTVPLAFVGEESAPEEHEGHMHVHTYFIPLGGEPESPETIDYLAHTFLTGAEECLERLGLRHIVELVADAHTALHEEQSLHAPGLRHEPGEDIEERRN